MKKVLVLLFVIILLTSCTKEDNAINVALSSEPVTLDIMINSSLSGRLIASGSIYEKLLVLDGEDNIKEELCSSYYLSSDNKTLTFVLLSNVYFHDGTIMTAEDVASSMNRWIELYSKAKEIVGEARFRAKDDNTVEIKSASSLVFLPLLIASSPQEAVIMPSSVIGDSLTLTSVIGTGPYVLKEWSKNEKIVLERFDLYKEYSEESNGRWGKKEAKTEVINYYFVSDSVTRVLALESGQYDFINDLMYHDRERILNNEELEIIEARETGSIALVFNKKNGVMTDKRMREAASLSFNNLQLMQACYGKGGFSLHSDYMEAWQDMWITGEENPYYKEDKEKARDIVNDYYTGETITILTSNLSSLDKIALKAKEDLEMVGFNVEVVVRDWASMLEMRKDDKAWDIYVSAFTSVPLPWQKNYLVPAFPGWIEEDSFSYSLLLSLSSSETVEEASRAWEKVERALYEYIPCYIPGHYTTLYAKNKKLSGVIIEDGFFFWNATKDGK